MSEQDLAPEQRTMVEAWERHMAAEFETKNIDDDGRGFYRAHFIPGHSPDTVVQPVARTVVEPACEPSNGLVRRVG